jgi:hypothetical protein
MLFIEVVCIASVVGAAAWRIVAARGMPNVGRLATAGATTVVVIGIGVFALAGPLRPGWSKRAGTSSALLAQIAAKFAAQSGAGVSTGTSASTTVPSTTQPGSTSALPTVPFTANVTGTVQQSSPNSAGDVTVQLTLQVQGTNAPLVVRLSGPAVNGGVSMTSSNVTFGTEQGTVTGLNGSNVQAALSGPSGKVDLALQLTIDQNAGTISGTVSGTARGGR